MASNAEAAPFSVGYVNAAGLQTTRSSSSLGGGPAAESRVKEQPSACQKQSHRELQRTATSLDALLVGSSLGSKRRCEEEQTP